MHHSLLLLYIQRIKKSNEDYEFYDTPGSSAGLPPPVTDPICDFCLKTSSCNRQGLFEELLMCKDCNAKGNECSAFQPETGSLKAHRERACPRLSACCISVLFLIVCLPCKVVVGNECHCWCVHLCLIG